MSILSLCEWLQSTNFGTYVRESALLFPFIEGSHLLGLTLMLGPTLMFDLRLAGFAWKQHPVSKIYKTFLPITTAGAVLMVVTGLILFWAEPVKCYNSGYFRIKVLGLFLASLNAAAFHFSFYPTVGSWDDQAVPPLRARMAGFLSMFLWALVVMTGRYTAYTL